MSDIKNNCESQQSDSQANNNPNVQSRSHRILGYTPSRLKSGQYVVLMETSAEECESWYYFIRKEGNESELVNLQKQLEKIKWYIEEDLCTFDLDLENPVSAQTAKEMTKIDINAESFHRKFDGKLKPINFQFSKKDEKSTLRMMEKVFDQLSYGQIEDYISDEDIDSDDLQSESESDDEPDYSDESRSNTASSSSPSPKKPVVTAKPVTAGKPVISKSTNNKPVPRPNNKKKKNKH